MYAEKVAAPRILEQPIGASIVDQFEKAQPTGASIVDQFEKACAIANKPKRKNATDLQPANIMKREQASQDHDVQPIKMCKFEQSLEMCKQEDPVEM